MLMNPAIQDTSPSRTSIKMGSALAAAVIAAAWVMAFQGVSAQVEAGLQVPAVNIERLDKHPPAANCTHQAWPYYQRDCLRARGEPVGEMRTVRIVPIDRMQATAAK